MNKSADINTQDEKPRARKIPQFCRYAGIGRSKLYEEIRAGKLRAVKLGRSTLILDEDGEEYLNSLPTITNKAA